MSATDFSDRRAFLQRLTIGAAGLGVAPSLLHASQPTARDVAADHTSAFSEFASAEEQQADPVWDTSWTKKITGKHRAMFDVPQVSGGSGVLRAGLWARQYTEVFKAQPSDFSPVIVLRHEGIILAMNQAFWDEYNVGKQNNVRDDKNKKTNTNPVLAAAPTDGKPASPFSQLMLEQQISRGVIVLACNMAFGGVVRDVVKKDKLKMPEARAKAISMMVPGIILQPSGIFANVLAQQNGCSFVAAS